MTPRWGTVRGRKVTSARHNDVVAPTGEPIEVVTLSHHYPSPTEGRVEVLRHIDLSLPAGGYLALTGNSGAGKSTLLSVIGGLEQVQTGSVRVGDVDLTALDRNDLAEFRRRTVGFVFQHFGLLETLTALENVEVALTLAGLRRGQRARVATALLCDVGLSHRLHHRAVALSGGERQRVALARALANEPRVILADEPTGNLDEDSAATVIDLLEMAVAERGCTLVVVTHNRKLAARAPHRLHLIDGRTATDAHLPA